MYSPYVVVVVLGLAAMCSASRKQDGFFPRGYASSPRRYAQPRQSYSDRAPYGYEDRAAESSLDILSLQLEVLEAREEIQVDRLGTQLVDRSNKNLAFRNTISSLQARSIEIGEQQFGRIADLEKKIEAIKALRTRVHDLNKAAADIREGVEDVYQKRKEIMKGINGLRNSGLRRQSVIEEAQTRADNLNDRIDDLIVKSCANRDEIFSLTTISKTTVDRGNADVSAGQGIIELSPSGNSGSSTLTRNIDPPLIGAPQARQAGFNGIEINRKKSHYPSGYPSIYFSFSQTVSNDRAEYEAVDMSTGGWSVDRVIGQDIYRYYPSDRLPKIH